MSQKDYYRILGVEETATETEIKRAYRRLARQYHPDRNPGNVTAEETFKRINEAYEVLSDSEKRRKYDAARRSPTGTFRNWRQRAQSGQSGAGVEDLFGSIFGGFGRQAQRSHTRTAASRRNTTTDIEQTVDVTLREAYSGTTRLVTLNMEQFEVTIPPGVKTGSKIRIRGKGKRGPADERGDLYLKVNVLEDPRFKREGDDLIIEVPIDLYTAVLGGEARVQTLDGAVILTIPPGTDGGRRLRLRGKGMPRLKSPEQFGDLYAEVEIEVPSALSARERELFETLRQMRQEK